ncbi:uncharacterized protein N7515_007940 [Penicillium bovifimosum]|uniref:Uncharacterized protein n=1 Tax=Penicillium bovifimosum TaxID=126998 RepID=A0A9W9GLZ5_9EURO|nr:uncharacterized protein N7515_007940 [Penicillium bovifimosum]KAJ5124115.1 hypothetical protein N7515_007940 [Penicillium bovifimosum]
MAIMSIPHEFIPVVVLAYRTRYPGIGSPYNREVTRLQSPEISPVTGRQIGEVNGGYAPSADGNAGENAAVDLQKRRDIS